MTGTYRPPAPGPLYELLTFIDGTLGGDLTNRALARRAGLSLRALTKRFHEVTGLSPHAYVEQRRMEAAARLLERDGARVAQVMRGCGYEKRATFDRAFTRRFAVTPARYRIACAASRVASDRDPT
jgi:AraC family transcriptional regulator